MAAVLKQLASLNLTAAGTAQAFSATVSTTADQAIDLTWEWGSASPSNTIAIQTMYMEIL